MTDDATRSRVPDEIRSIPCPTCGEMMLVEGEGNGESCEDCPHATPDRVANTLTLERDLEAAWQEAARAYKQERGSYNEGRMDGLDKALQLLDAWRSAQ